MDSSELLRLQLAKKLECSRIGYASGPTGPQGGIGVTGPIGPAGYQKLFTIFIDLAGVNPVGSIARVYIPPGFSTNPTLAAGGIFTQDIPNVIAFRGSSSLEIFDTVYTFPIGLFATGFSPGLQIWSPSRYSLLGGPGAIQWNTLTKPVNNRLRLLNLSVANFGTSGTAPLSMNAKYLFLPGTNIPDAIGWSATLTIYYL